MNVTNYPELNEKLYSYTHSNGVKIYIVSKPGFSKKAAFFTTRYGSIDNEFVPKGKTDMIEVPDGIAHFLEHKMFEMPNNQSVFEMFGKFGASANAYTSFNMTAYFFWCTANFENNLEILLNYVQTPYFTDENVAKEQGIIAQEIKMYDDNPAWKSYFNMLGCLYHNHPISRDIAGTVDSISKIDKDTLYMCYNTFYHPSNMVICAIGDFSAEDVKVCIDKNLKDTEPLPKIKRNYPCEPKSIAKNKIVDRLSVSMPLFCVGFKDNTLLLGNEQMKRKYIVNVLLNIIIGKSSNFYNEMYKIGLIDDGFSYSYSSDESFAFTEITGQSRDPEKLAEEIIKAIKSVTITEEDFLRTKSKLFGNMMRVFNSLDDYADRLSRYNVLELDMYESYMVSSSVSLEDIKEALKTHITEKNMAISIINPL